MTTPRHDFVLPRNLTLSGERRNLATIRLFFRVDARSGKWMGDIGEKSFHSKIIKRVYGREGKWTLFGRTRFAFFFNRPFI